MLLIALYEHDIKSMFDPTFSGHGHQHIMQVNSYTTIPIYTKSRRKNKSYLLLLPNLSCNFGLWREFLLFLPYVTCTTIILPPKKTTMGQNFYEVKLDCFHTPTYQLLQLPNFSKQFLRKLLNLEIVENSNFLPIERNFCCGKTIRGNTVSFRNYNMQIFRLSD